MESCTVVRKLPGNSAYKNVLTQKMINRENTVYVINYDYDLNNGTITLPSNCELRFEGGSISNGKIQSKEGNVVGLKNKRDGRIFNNVILYTASSGYGLNWRIKGVAKSGWFNNDNNILYNARAFDGLVLEEDVEVTDNNLGYSYNELWAWGRDYAIYGNGHTIRIHNGNKERQEAFIRCINGKLTMRDVNITMDAENMYSTVSAVYLDIDNCTVRSKNRCLTASSRDKSIKWNIKNTRLYSKTFAIEATASSIDEVAMDGCVIDDVYDGEPITFGYDKISIGNNYIKGYEGKVIIKNSKLIGGIESVHLDKVLLQDCELAFPSVGSRGDNLQSNRLEYSHCRFVGFPDGLTMRNGFRSYISCFDDVTIRNCTFDIKNYEDFYDGSVSHGCMSFRKVGNVRLLNNRFEAVMVKGRNWFNSDIDFVECGNVELSGNEFDSKDDTFYRMHADKGTKISSRKKNTSTARHFLIGTKTGSGLPENKAWKNCVLSEGENER